MKVTLSAREYQEIREKVQLIETIIDGAILQKEPDKARLSKALGATRSIQSKYFPQINYSLYYFRSLQPDGKQPLSRRNFRKWKRLRSLKMNRKIADFSAE